MGNKDEKTFTDIFSSSSNESEKTITTFSDILNSSKSEKLKEEVHTLTFDNILKNDEQEVTIKENEPDEDNSEDVTSFNSLLDTKGEDLENYQNANDKFKEEDIAINKDNSTLETNNKTSFNPFLEDELQNIEENLKKELNDVKEDIQTEDNPFLNNIPKLEEEKNLEFENNLFFQTNNDNNEIIEEKSEIINDSSIDFNANPFINEEKITDKEEMETKNDTFIDFSINPFISSETTIDEEKANNSEIKQDTNPFFENEKSLEEEINSDNNEEEKKTVAPVSSSPFFEEEKKQEENPFFQNQLNLIENSEAPTGKSTNIDTNATKHYNVKVVKKKEPLIKFILGVLSYALFIFLLLIGVTLLIYVLDIKIRAAKGDYSSPTFNAYVVLTGSMLPEIKVKDVVVTKKTDAKDLKEGDVITFASADSRFLGTIITHRIIKKNPPSGNEGYTFQTRGDNNNVADSALVPEKNIFGKVIIKIPKLGYLQEFLATDGGWIIVILIPCLTVISYDTVKLIKGLRRKKYKNIKVQK